MSTFPDPHYPDVDHMQLDADGGYYCRHVAAMTDEDLHRKSDIAGQLGMRDREIDILRARVAAMVPRPQVSATTQRLIDLLIERDQAGLAKYGTTLDRTDLSHTEWLQHMTEEALDAAGYAQAAIRTYQERGK